VKAKLIFIVLLLSFSFFTQAKENYTVILVTGFEPFWSYNVNPSQLIAEELNGTSIEDAVIIGVILPVDYEKAENKMEDAIEKYAPSIIISTGLSYYSRKICVEKLGVNLKSIYINEKWAGLAIINSSSPFILFSTVPTKKIVEEMRKEGVVAKQSFFAGTYTCNYLLYTMLNYVKTKNLEIKVGFIHLPPLKEQAKHGMEFNEMLKAIRIAIIVCLETN